MSNYCLKLLFLLIFFFFLSALGSPIYATHKCGDGNCQGPEHETCSSCPADCGVCSAPTPIPTPTNTSSDSTPSSSSSSSGGGESNPPPYTGPTIYPSVLLNPQTKNPTNKTNLTFTGHASIEQGVVDDVQYSFDNGVTWSSAVAVDGKFDENFDEFTFVRTFVEGKYEVIVRSKSLSQIFTQSSNYGTDSFVVATTPPSVSLDPPTPNLTSDQTPELTGKITTKLVNLARAEITLDGGSSWKKLKAAKGRFSFLPEPLEDGNYQIKVRVEDLAGNRGESKTEVLVVDTIPPLLGGSHLSLGSNILTPSRNGVIRVVGEAMMTLVLSMRGGVIKSNATFQGESFALESVPGTHLWKGQLKLGSEGEGDLKVAATDGAGNITSRDIGRILVEVPGKVQDKSTGQLIKNARVKLFNYSTAIKKWVEWDSEPFGQTNPQTTDEFGRYSFMVPPGKYFIGVKAKDYRELQSEVMELSEPLTIVNFDLPLESRPSLSFNLPVLGKISFKLFSFVPSIVKLMPSAPTLETTAFFLESGTPLPQFSLPTLDGNLIDSASFRGRKLVLTFISGWSQASLEEASILQNLAKELKEDEALIAVFLQESQASTQALMARGRYNFPIVFDKNGETAAAFKISTLPQHFLVDKKGNIQKVFSGLTTGEELIDELGKLF